MSRQQFVGIFISSCDSHNICIYINGKCLRQLVSALISAETGCSVSVTVSVHIGHPSLSGISGIVVGEQLSPPPKKFSPLENFVQKIQNLALGIPHFGGDSETELKF